MSAQGRPDAVTDLSFLSPLSDDIILSCLRERFMSDNIYTNIGSWGLVALNPHKFISSDPDSVLQSYVVAYNDISERKEILPPHIHQLASNAYFHMRRTTRDQCLIFRGETGSGKSENRRLAARSLIQLSLTAPSRKQNTKLALKAPASDFVLESFTHARTPHNPDASRVGKYIELQFTTRGRLCGIKTLAYHLERARIVGAPPGERNFHIFYYLLAGATPEERQHLHLRDGAAYRYLGARSMADHHADAVRFSQLKIAFKQLGISKAQVVQVFRMLTAILHLGNVEFVVDRGRNDDACVVRNTDTLGTVADFLGVRAAALEKALTHKTKLVEKQLCTVFLDPDGAYENTNDLAKLLYSLLVAWLTEEINQRLSRDDFSTFIGLLDLPAPQGATNHPNSFDQFCVNLGNERLHRWVQAGVFESHTKEYAAEAISRFVPRTLYFDNSECLRLLRNMSGGLVHIIDDQAQRMPNKTNHTMVAAFQRRWGSHVSFKSASTDPPGFPTFTISHYSGPVTYSSEGFLEQNLPSLNPEFITLLRGNDSARGERTGSIIPLIQELFSTSMIATQTHARDQDTIVAAQQTMTPQRTPSFKRKAKAPTSGSTSAPAAQSPANKSSETLHEENSSSPRDRSPCIAGDLQVAFDRLFETLDETQAWYVFCINPNDARLPNQLEGRGVKAQIKHLGLSEIARRSANVFEVGMTIAEFCEWYSRGLSDLGNEEGTERERVLQTRTAFGFGESDIALGRRKVYLSQSAFHTFENHLRQKEQRESQQWRDSIPESLLKPRADPPATRQAQFEETEVAGPPTLRSSSHQSEHVYEDGYEDDPPRSEILNDPRVTSPIRPTSMSRHGSESFERARMTPYDYRDSKALMGAGLLAGELQDDETTESFEQSSARRRWVALCWLLTWWMPSPCLRYLGRMKRGDVRQAWREKLALNIIIWVICAAAVFVIVFLGNLVCPKQHVFSTNELASHSFNSNPNNVYTSIRGEVFDLTSLAATHQRAIGIIPAKAILKYGGQSADDIFPVQVSALCDGITGSVSPYVVLDSRNNTDPNAQYHDFRAFTNDSRPDWYFETMVQMRYAARLGYVGYTPKELKKMASSGKAVAVYNGFVYDLTSYIKFAPAIRSPAGTEPPPTDINFMDTMVLDVFKFGAGGDVTKQLDRLKMNRDVLKRQKVCLRNIFTIGRLDSRQSAQCQFSANILLALSAIMVTIIAFKFIASINFGFARKPEDHDKFVICQVPCYTEGDGSLRRTIDSLAQLKYDDKRKLLVVICDGMIVGSGNDRPTPRIVLDILGADPSHDPEPLSFTSLGEGAKQHNMGKVYSGLYECGGHVVPYLVIVKLGKPTERSRPGNRGKRDSQMLLMNFLNRVHFNSPMNPLELEMYHQIKNVIGVNPTFYEYLFMVDADTTVNPLSLNRLISAMIHDKKLLGVCGETELANAKQSIITMMQVYEYFISHHMAKTFESLFGSVTCLPGCFTLYRLRTPDTHQPLLISNQVIRDYSENRVDTLHMKNLLHLGEDRYLTTLLLKHFPFLKTQFVRDAHAYTVAPDDWKVLLSQRRRWINSTVHNLGELVFLDQLCGFCCFSMRFVVMIDLLSTLTQPVTVAYIGYLIYLVVGQGQGIPPTSLIMIGAIYGLQAFVFLLRRRWDMLGWMFFYILAIPVFSFFLPLYSFWKMDDFSWGSTRVVLGESGKKIIVHDEGKFDAHSIPLKSWTEFENELWDKESNHSIGSWVPPPTFKSRRSASLYGRQSDSFSAPPRASSILSESVALPPPEYQAARSLLYPFALELETGGGPDNTLSRAGGARRSAERRHSRNLSQVRAAR